VSYEESTESARCGRRVDEDQQKTPGSAQAPGSCDRSLETNQQTKMTSRCMLTALQNGTWMDKETCQQTSIKARRRGKREASTISTAHW